LEKELAVSNDLLSELVKEKLEAENSNQIQTFRQQGIYIQDDRVRTNIAKINSVLEGWRESYDEQSDTLAQMEG
jgi:hypothetical protein